MLISKLYEFKLMIKRYTEIYKRSNKMNVIVIKMLSDNFGYYVYREPDIQKGFFVDASEADKVQDFLKIFEIPSLTHLLTTHKH